MVNTPAPRLEIRDFMSDKYRATLFIRTLLNLQARPAERLTSYTSMASIHGSSTDFDGVTFRPAGADGGYCVHSHPSFGPWHRPYLMMMEQAIYEQAMAHAIQYKTADRAKYIAAARAMRLPFWDWGLKGGQVPSIFLQPTFVVTLPNGARQTVRNPLNQYTVPNDAVARFSLQGMERTIFRSWTKPTEALGRIVTWRSQLVAMFNATTFGCFTSGAGCNTTGNLEGLHGDIHNTVGAGGGQMDDIRYAAFDPIFWLHHCNVDRLLAVWEGLHPEAARDLSSIANEPAYPFRKTQTGSRTIWWTARDVMNAFDTSKRSTRRFGYYYPEFANPSVIPANLQDKVNQLYNDSPGRERTLFALPSARVSPIDGTATFAIAARTPAASNGALSSSRAEASVSGTRRTGSRVVQVTAGSVPIFAPDSSAHSFAGSGVIVDVTDALAKIKAANPNVGLVGVDIVATITPFDSNDTQATMPIGDVVNLGKPVITTMVDGDVTFKGTPNQIPAPAPSPALGPSGAPSIPEPSPVFAPSPPPSKRPVVGTVGISGEPSVPSPAPAPAPAPSPAPTPGFNTIAADVPYSDASLFAGEGSVQAVVQP